MQTAIHRPYPTCIYFKHYVQKMLRVLENVHIAQKLWYVHSLLFNCIMKPLYPVEKVQ